MEPISVELKRAVKCWLRRHKKWDVSNSQLNFRWRLDRNAEQVCRDGRGCVTQSITLEGVLLYDE